MRALLRLLTITAVAVLFVSCEMVQDLLGTSSDDASGGGPPPDPVFTSSVYRLEGVFKGAADISVDLGSSGRDLYYVYTNTSGNNISVGDGPTSNSALLWAPPDRVVFDGSSLAARSLPIERFEPARRGLPPEFSAVPRVPSGSDGTVGAASIAPSTLTSYSIGDTETLHTNASTSSPVSATVRGLSDDGVREVYIWVDNAGYGTYKAAGLPDSAYQELAEEFLIAGDNNDIYDWITAIFGAPWGAHGTTFYIPPDTDDVHVLLYDIENDKYAGFYWSKDNRIASTGVTEYDVPGSNERLMFYIDLPYFAKKDGTTWEITDPSPADMVATLAHEFQHMINFYQRTVLRDPPPYTPIDSWINEMASMVAEDLVADKLEISGPRGVNPTDGTGGDGTGGWLLKYIASAAAFSLTDYDDSVDLGAHYANYYSFGAYLSRTYGAELFTEIARMPVEQTFTAGNGEIALLAAIEAVTGETAPEFDELIRRWTVAMFVSDDTTVDSPYRVNRGTWFASETNGTSFNLGSIDLYRHYNYFSPSGGTPFWYWGPLIHDYGGSRIEIADEANAFFIRVKTGTGPFQESVNLDAGVTLTVLSKASS